MIDKIQWMTSGSTEMPDFDRNVMSAWIDRVISLHGCRKGKINYMFCDDDKILEVNRRFLGHDYYTDIITFDYTRGNTVSGDIYISLDTVRSNAELVGDSYDRELHRVIIHGVLHLCGIDDKGPGEREIMESHENQALDLLNESSINP